MQLPRLGPIARTSLQTLAVYGLRLGVQVALLFGVARYLGPEAYGEFAAVAALALGLGTLSAFGLGFLVLGESAKSPECGRDLLAQALPATLLSAAMLAPLYGWLATAVLGSEAGGLTLGLIALSELLLVPWLGLLSHRLHGLGQVARSQVLMLLPMGLRLAGLVACITLAPDAGLLAYALVHAAGAALGLAVAVGLDAGRAGALVRPVRLKRDTLKQGAGYAAMSFMAVNPSELDKALALRLLGAGDTGLYALASRGMAVVTLPVLAMLQAALPRLIHDLDRSPAAGRRLLRVTLLLSGLYGLAAALILYLAAPALLDWLLGPAYLGIGAVVARIALIAPFQSLRMATGTTLYALGRPLLRSGIEGGAIVLLIGLAVVMAPRLGIEGLVYAVLASEAAMATMGVLALASHLRHPQQSGPVPLSLSDTSLG